jgi:hypothetical protein
VIAYDSHRWSKFPEPTDYAQWLESLLRKALPQESFSFASLELRNEPAGSVDDEIDKLHTDGGYIRSVYSLRGPAPVYRDGKTELSVPRGQTLLMTALARTRAIGPSCTLHRRPGAGATRALIVCSFEPVR